MTRLEAIGGRIEAARYGAKLADITGPALSALEDAEFLFAEIARLKAQVEAAEMSLKVIDSLRWDEGLNFVPKTAPEAYLQNALKVVWNESRIALAAYAVARDGK
mgnify:CR=1 FL=1